MECERLCRGSGVSVCVAASSVHMFQSVQFVQLVESVMRVMFMFSSVCVCASVKCRRPCKVRVGVACVVVTVAVVVAVSVAVVVAVPVAVAVAVSLVVVSVLVSLLVVIGV